MRNFIFVVAIGYAGFQFGSGAWTMCDVRKAIVIADQVSRMAQVHIDYRIEDAKRKAREAQERSRHN